MSERGRMVWFFSGYQLWREGGTLKLVLPKRPSGRTITLSVREASALGDYLLSEVYRFDAEAASSQSPTSHSQESLAKSAVLRRHH